MVARKARLHGVVYNRADEFELLCFRSPALQSSGGIYLSAGIHGDEPAGTEGLYQWAELHCTDVGADVKKDSVPYTFVHPAKGPKNGH